MDDYWDELSIFGDSRKLRDVEAREKLRSSIQIDENGLCYVEETEEEN